MPLTFRGPTDWELPLALFGWLWCLAPIRHQVRCFTVAFAHRMHLLFVALHLFRVSELLFAQIALHHIASLTLS
jgi:hypothetical protein